MTTTLLDRYIYAFIVRDTPTGECLGLACARDDLRAILTTHRPELTGTATLNRALDDRAIDDAFYEPQTNILTPYGITLTAADTHTEELGIAEYHPTTGTVTINDVDHNALHSTPAATTPPRDWFPQRGYSQATEWEPAGDILSCLLCTLTPVN